MVEGEGIEHWTARTVRLPRRQRLALPGDGLRGDIGWHQAWLAWRLAARPPRYEANLSRVVAGYPSAGIRDHARGSQSMTRAWKGIAVQGNGAAECGEWGACQCDKDEGLARYVIVSTCTVTRVCQ